MVFKKKSLEAQPVWERKRYRALSPALKNGNEYCVLLCSDADVISVYFDKDNKILRNVVRGNLIEMGPVDTFENKAQRFQRSVRLNANSKPIVVL
ncbi:MAG: hypothetical protein R2877_04715 [Bdellovibrionota bacterium]